MLASLTRSDTLIRHERALQFQSIAPKNFLKDFILPLPVRSILPVVAVILIIPSVLNCLCLALRNQDTTILVEMQDLSVSIVSKVGRNYRYSFIRCCVWITVLCKGNYIA